MPITNDTEHPARRWVSISEAAGYVGAHRTSMYRWMEERGLPWHGWDGNRRIDLNELDAFIERGGV